MNAVPTVQHFEQEFTLNHFGTQGFVDQGFERLSNFFMAR